ncbi:MAG: hypothetical protein MUF22_09405 [Chitinispirillaceae bacterium]|nr:hypothetical protein [Chitinispirillaceae bacterium]
MTRTDESLAGLMSRGILKENTIFGLGISLCPAIAVTASVKNGFFMGISVLFVQTLVQVIISSIRKWIHPSVRLPMFMVIISGMVTLVDRCVAAFAPPVYAEVGLYIQLIVAFASILAGLETFASKTTPVRAFFDGVGRGSGFLLSLMLIGAIREILGRGSMSILLAGCSGKTDDGVTCAAVSCAGCSETEKS